MTAQEFRERVAELVRGKPVKVWYVRNCGHRLEFVWSVGEPRFSPEETLARCRIHYLVGQDVPPELRPELIRLFNEYCESEDARRSEAAVRPLRLIPLR